MTHEQYAERHGWKLVKYQGRKELWERVGKGKAEFRSYDKDTKRWQDLRLF